MRQVLGLTGRLHEPRQAGFKRVSKIPALDVDLGRFFSIYDAKSRRKMKEGGPHTNKRRYSRKKQQRKAGLPWQKGSRTKGCPSAAGIRKRMRIAQYVKAAIGWRKTVKEGTESHCGVVIQVRPTIFQIKTMHGVHWFKVKQPFPPGIKCAFRNIVYLKRLSSV
jgi:hypothetical protein